MKYTIVLNENPPVDGFLHSTPALMHAAISRDAFRYGAKEALLEGGVACHVLTITFADDCDSALRDKFEDILTARLPNSESIYSAYSVTNCKFCNAEHTKELGDNK